MGTNHLAMRPSVRLTVTLLAALSIIAAQVAVFAPQADANFLFKVSFEFKKGDITGFVTDFKAQGTQGNNIEIPGYAWDGREDGKFHVSCSADPLVGTKARVDDNEPAAPYTVPFDVGDEVEITYAKIERLDNPGGSCEDGSTTTPASIVSILKVVDGDGTPPGSDFPFELKCDDQTDEPFALGDGAARSFDVTAGDECTVEETDPQDADSVTWKIDEITIEGIDELVGATAGIKTTAFTVSEGQELLITFTNTYGGPDDGTIEVAKVLGGDAIPDDLAPFTFTVTCDGDTVGTLTYDTTDGVTNEDNTLDVSDGANCTIAEDGNQGATSTSWQLSGDAGSGDGLTTDSFDVGENETITVTFTNTYDAPPVVTNPDITLTKTAVTVDADSLIPGELVDFQGSKIFFINDEVTGPFEITYTFEIENTGDVTLFNVELIDPLLGGTVTIDQDLSGGFAPGDVATASATYTLTQDDIVAGTVPNTATVSAVDEEQTEVSDTADETIEILEVAGIVLSPNISITKDAVDGVTADDEGNLLVTIEGEDGTATVSYRMVVTNTGDDDLQNLTLVDDKIGNLTGALTTALVDAFGSPTLPAGESVTVFVDHEVTADDFDGITLTNVVEVVGTGVDSGASVDDADDETVTLIQVLAEALPRTGIDTLALGALSLLLALLGAVTLLFSRRRDEGTS